MVQIQQEIKNVGNRMVISLSFERHTIKNYYYYCSILLFIPFLTAHPEKKRKKTRLNVFYILEIIFITVNFHLMLIIDLYSYC